MVKVFISHSSAQKENVRMLEEGATIKCDWIPDIRKRVTVILPLVNR